MILPVLLQSTMYHQVLDAKEKKKNKHNFAAIQNLRAPIPSILCADLCLHLKKDKIVLKKVQGEVTEMIKGYSNWRVAGTSEDSSSGG